MRRAWRALTAPVGFPTLALLLLMLALLMTAFRLDTVQPDTWWALRAGKDMWHTGKVPHTDTYSFTAYGRPWPDHEWLWQVIAYGLYHVGDLLLLSVINGIVAVVAVALARPSGRVTWVDVVVLAPAVSIVSLAWSVRPQVVGLLMLALLVRMLQAGRWRTVVLVMLLWANLHGSAVYGGLILVAATAAAAAGWAFGGRRAHQARRARALALTTLASAAATLINPMGYGLWKYVATASSRPGQKSIAEWRPSWDVPLGTTIWLWVWCGLVVLVVVVRWRRLRRWPVVLDVAATAVIAPLALTAVRNIGALGIVSIPLLIRLLRPDGTGGPEGADRPDRPGGVLPGGRVLLAVATAAVAAAAALGFRQDTNNLGWHPMSPEAARAIAACPRNVYTTYNTGAYLTWFTPSVKVFIDNRQDPYPKSVIDLGGITPQSAWQTAFAKYHIQCAALSYIDAPELVTLGVFGHWTAQYADNSWVVFTKPGLTLRAPQ